MDACVTELRTLGDGVVDAPDGPGWTDICGRAIGRPSAVLRPRTTEDVARAVQICRRHRRGVVPVGGRTAYWWPLDVDGVVAVDPADLTGVRLDDGVAEVGAGTWIRPLDEHLRAHERHLAFHPDAFGDTPIGAVAAVGGTSGLGMAQGPIGRWVTGLEVVTGAGEVLRTGTAGTWPHLPVFLRDGLPDLTGLILASEGTLGIITRVWLRAPPAPWFGHLRFTAADTAGVTWLARHLCERGVIDTFRAARYAEGGPLASAWTCDVWVRSPWSAEEATRVGVAVQRLIRRRLQVEPTLTVEDDAARRTGAGRWSGPLGGHAAFAARGRLVGLDVNAPWAHLPAVLAAGEACARAQAAVLPATRLALYFAPDFVNLGVHGTAAPDQTAWAHAHVRDGLASLWDAGVIPYRAGHAWPDAVWDAANPTWREAVRALRRALDPDGILHPGHPLAR